MTKLTDQRAREIADAIDAYDAEIETLQSGKRDTFQSAREELEGAGLDRATITSELTGLKAAITKRRKRAKDPEAVDDREELTEAYFAILDRPSRMRAARHAREGSKSTRIEPAPAYGSTAGPAETSASRQEVSSDASGGMQAETCAPSPQQLPEQAPQLPADAGVKSEADPASLPSLGVSSPDLPAASSSTSFEAQPVLSGDEQNTRPEDLLPVGQDEAQMVQGQNGSDEDAVREPGDVLAAQSEQLRHDAGAGEGSASPVDPAPAPDARRGRKLTRPEDFKLATPFFAKLLAAEYGVDLDQVDALRFAVEVRGMDRNDAKAFVLSGGADDEFMPGSIALSADVVTSNENRNISETDRASA